MDRFKIISKNQADKLPATPGVYALYAKKQAIYIGKAANLKSRIKNHFQQPSYRDNLFINKINKVGFYKTNSEIEALILEASLIKKYQPKFNVMWRDDKSYFYVALRYAQGKPSIPYIYITHQPPAKLNAKPYTLNPIYIGPFTEGTALKKTLRFLRRVFPYYTSAKHPKNKCTYCHLGLCPGPVRNSSLASEISNGAGPFLNLPEYKKNLKKLVLILRGKKGFVLSSLKKEMKTASKNQNFEEAGKIRDRIYHLEQVISHAHVINGSSTGQDAFRETSQILQGLLSIEKNIQRIECYDVSNMQGKQATGSMVVFENGKPDKNAYRKFKIKMENKPNDIAMLRETLERRFLHNEWPYPEAILIDGGIAQLNVAIKTKNKKAETKGIRVISIAKKSKDPLRSRSEARLFIEGRDKPVLLKSLPQKIYNLIVQLDDEAHRFAIAYHKKLRKKSLLS